MPIIYKTDVLEALKVAGYSSYKLRQEKVIGERQLQQIREGSIVSPACLDKLCTLLDCQPGDLLEHVPEDTNRRGQ